jgi:hypothetical protein
MSAILQLITPAELQLMKDRKAMTLRETLRLTMLDLILRQILQVEKEGDESPTAVVTEGPKFKSYRPLPHEAVFTDQYKSMPGNRLLMINLTKTALQKAKSLAYYQELIYTSPRMKGWIKRSFFQRIFGGHALTAEGQIMLDNTRREQERLNQRLPQLAEREPAEAMKEMAPIGAHLYGLSAATPAMFLLMDHQLMHSFRPTPPNKNDYTGDAGGLTPPTSNTNIDSSYFSSGGYGGDEGGGGTLSILGLAGDTFDNSFSDAGGSDFGFSDGGGSDNSSGDSGDSGGDGGGGGCSGCGGGGD